MRVKTFIMATSAAGALALSAGAAAAEPNGWYGALDAGYHTLGDVETRSQTTGAAFDIGTEGDWAAFARLGYRFDQNWRVELEGGYRQNDLELIDRSGPGVPTGVCNLVPATGACNAPDGELQAATLMVNVLFDFGSEGDALRPFIGLGAGVNRVGTNFIGTFANARGISVGADDSSNDLAAQGIAGLAWAISDRAHLDLTYRYLISNLEFDTFIDAHEPLPLYSDPRFQLPFELPGKGKMPQTVLLDRQGRIRAHLSGEADWASPDVIALVDALLAEPA